MVSYISDHWHGQQSIRRSFGLNFIVLNVIGYVIVTNIDDETFDTYYALYPNDTYAAASALLVLIVPLICFYTWQAVGAWRSAVRTYDEGGDWGTSAFVKGFITCGICLNLWIGAVGFVEGAEEAAMAGYEIGTASCVSEREGE